MSSRKTPFIAETFDAVAQSGTRHRVRLWKFRHEETLLDGRTDRYESAWKLDTERGQPVNQDVDGSLTLAQTGERLTRC